MILAAIFIGSMVISYITLSTLTRLNERKYDSAWSKEVQLRRQESLERLQRALDKGYHRNDGGLR